MTTDRERRIAEAVQTIERIEREEREAADRAARERLPDAAIRAAEAAGMSPAYYEAMQSVRNVSEYEALRDRFPGGATG